ncbi:cupin domain-containing protein [Rhodoblastus sp.]|uniref:cupin domain-containing protein n=1 Tax=Rhodoblastus sp. TaxID=1962975 RepID=UPI0025FA5E1A|nr:cupin domain-containing protein [Rhodoblastus sp.]
MIDLRDPSLNAQAVREALGLAPHPEGGAFREIWRDTPDGGGRGAATSIFFLLAAGEISHWHRVDAAELWLWQAGAPLTLELSANPPQIETISLGPDLGAGQKLQAIVPAGAWQAAKSLGAWTLVSCVVAPAFKFSGFELAPPDWSPGG